MNQYRVPCAGADIVVYQFLFAPLKSNMYVLLSGTEALVVDPNRSDEALALLQEHHVRYVTIFLTHEHVDHTSGVVWLQEHFSNQLICQQYCAQKIAHSKNNRPLLLALIAHEHKDYAEQNAQQDFLKNYHSYECVADVTFDQEYSVSWQNHEITITATPGHTPGSCCIMLDKSIVFTGDSWIKETSVITRFPGGDARAYIEITLRYLKALDDKIKIMPGHGEPFFAGEQRDILDIDPKSE